MSTESKVFTISKLQEYRDENRADSPYQLEIPSFQRGLVWSESKKTNLIHSISCGFPIGALLMYVKPMPSGSKKVLQIIDGLQRSTAILDYLNAPLRIAPIAKEFVSENTYWEIVRFAADYEVQLSVQELAQAVDSWAQEVGVAEPAAGFTGKKIRLTLETQRNQDFEPKFASDLEDLFTGKIIQGLQSTFKSLSSYEIPVILYSGDESNLPEIFEVLNSGTPLTKYDKFGAAWNNQRVVTKEPAIRSAMRDRYRVYVEKDWDVADFDPNAELGEDALNLFEYLVGLGHHLSSTYKHVFSTADVKGDAPSIAFALATVAHGLRLSDMDKLPSRFARLAGDVEVIDPTKFEAALHLACQIIDSILSPFLSLKLNLKDASDRFIPHSDLQLVSLITRFALEMHDPKTWDLRSDKTQIEELKDQFLAHYVIDMVRDSWKGSGDSTAFNRVWDEKPDGSGYVPSSYYLKRPTRDEFVQAMGELQTVELKKNQNSRSNISNKSKMLLRFVYADIVSHRDNRSVIFQIEHLHPVAKLTTFIKAKKLDGLPISALGNLAILTEADNVFKGEEYIGDYLVNHPEKVKDPDKVQEYVIAPELSEITQATLTNADAYLDFCKARFDKQIQIIAKNIGY